MVPCVTYGHVCNSCVGRRRYPPHMCCNHGLTTRHGSPLVKTDGNNRWNRGYVHCALGAPGRGPGNLASWWLVEGAETWKTVLALPNECDFAGQIRAAATAKLPHEDGAAHALVFFLWAHGKAHGLLAGGHGSAKQSPGAMLCRCCSENRDTLLPRFGSAEVANAGIQGLVRFTRVLCDIPADRRILYITTPLSP